MEKEKLEDEMKELIKAYQATGNERFLARLKKINNELQKINKESERVKFS